MRTNEKSFFANVQQNFIFNQLSRLHLLNVNANNLIEFTEKLFENQKFQVSSSFQIRLILLLVNEVQILNFYKHFIYKNLVMNFKISGIVGFAG